MREEAFCGEGSGSLGINMDSPAGKISGYCSDPLWGGGGGGAKHAIPLVWNVYTYGCESDCKL